MLADSIKICGFAVVVAAGLAIPMPAFAQTALVPVPLSSCDSPGNGISCEPCCLDGGPEARPVRGWITAEFLTWWMDHGHSPALASTSPAGTPLATAGVLGQSGTTVAFPNPDLNYGTFAGGRFNACLLPSEGKLFGIEASFFFLGKETINFNGASDATGNPILARPFFDVFTHAETALPVAFPGSFSGTLSIESGSRLLGSEFNLTEPLIDGPRPVRFLLGFVFLRLDESIGVTQDTTLIGGNTILPFVGFPQPIGSQVIVADSFETHSEFFGAQAGIEGEWGWERLRLAWALKAGVGATNNQLNIHGSTTLVPPTGGTPSTVVGGLLALPSNIGSFSATEYSFITQGQLKFRYLIGTRASLAVGYDFLWWNGVARPGDQISPNIDSRQIPTSINFPRGGVTAIQPNPQVNPTGLWVQGLSFELGFRF
jgi:hypothetical protein